MSFLNRLPGDWHLLLASLLMFTHVLVGALSGQVSFQAPPPSLHIATSSIPIGVLISSTTTSAATTTQKLIAQKPAPVVVPSPVASTTPVIQTPPLPADQVNTQTRAALVNILCTTRTGGYFEPISGSGVIVDTRGVILTNAHVGQYFLLQNYPTPNNINCVIRQGSPAQSLYIAELLYLPPEWVEANSSQIAAQQPTGTGENDYAFLLITGSTNPQGSLPSSFPVLSMTTDEPNVGDQMLLAAYPAGFLGGSTIQINLYVSSALAAVQALYTFSDPHNVDVISVGGTVVSQSGSSGGAVVSLQTGSLVGLITTDTSATTTAQRDLHAITLAHINRSLESEGQGGIAALLSQDLTSAAADFNTNTAPGETLQLEAALNK